LQRQMHMLAHGKNPKKQVCWKTNDRSMPSTLKSVDGEVQHPLYWSRKFLVQVSNKNNSIKKIS
jgi:hypothetical protein